MKRTVQVNVKMTQDDFDLLRKAAAEALDLFSPDCLREAPVASPTSAFNDGNKSQSL